ncbi:MAG: ATP-binding protein [Gammaproteobacteria bacterium]
MIGIRTVRNKLLLVVLATNAAALSITAVLMVAYDLHTFRETLQNDLSAQADVLGLAAGPALEFDDPEAAKEYLELLRAKPIIHSAAIYTSKGAVFATYSGTADAHTEFPKIPESDSYQIRGGEVVLSKRIVSNNEILGTVYFSAAYEPNRRLRDYLGILGLVLAGSLAATVLMFLRIQNTVTGPILDVTAVARRVMEERDFSLRARKTTHDEVGVLVDAFNSMLSEIGNRTTTLEQSNRELQREIAEREGAVRARDRSERRIRTLVSAITKVVWVADWRGHITEESSSWQTYTGQRFEQYRDAGWLQAFDEQGRKEVELAWAHAANVPATFELELRLWHAVTERHHYVRLRAVPVIDQDGGVAEWIGAVQDIEDRRVLEQSLRTLNTELEQRVADRTSQLQEANKDLETFSYSVSHDLRAPIRAIGGFCTLLVQDHAAQLDAEARRKFGVIQSEAARMGVLIDDLLAFSRLGRKALQATALDMRELANKAYAQLTRDQPDRKVEFRLGSLPTANGDRSLFEQVWVNLLSNAVKFSSKKENATIEVGAISEEREHVYFVRDNGAGFDPRYGKNLFGVFQRLHGNDEFPGTGVGLALVHRIVTRHGGRIWADSKLGEGATFHFTVPKESSGGAV